MQVSKKFIIHGPFLKALLLGLVEVVLVLKEVLHQIKGRRKQGDVGSKTQGFSPGKRRRKVSGHQLYSPSKEIWSRWDRGWKGPGEVLREKKRADRLPNTSDHTEMTILRDFSILLGSLQRSGDSNLPMKQKEARWFLIWGGQTVG